MTAFRKQKVLELQHQSIIASNPQFAVPLLLIQTPVNIQGDPYPIELETMNPPGLDLYL